MSTAASLLYRKTFLITFRIAHEPTALEYARHLTALGRAVEVASDGQSWKDPTSCHVFSSSKTIDEVAALVARAIRASKDVALIVRLDGTPEARVVGLAPDVAGLAKVLPYIKKVG